MGLVRNLKKKLKDWGDKILVELSCRYIKQVAKQTTKRQDNSSQTMYSQNPLTTESPSTTIVTSSQDTSERTTMIMETEDIVAHVRGWAVDRFEDIESIGDSLSVYQEFAEWIEPQGEEIEIVALDEISEEEYDSYVE